MNLFTKSATAAVLAIMIGGAAATAETFVFAHGGPEEHETHRASVDFLQKLEEVSGGEIKAEYHYGGALGDWATIFEQVQQGAIQMAITYGFSEYDPRLDLQFMAYIVDDWQSGREVFGPGGEMIDIYRTILKDQNLDLLTTIPSGGFYGVGMRKGVGVVPVNFPEDAEGLKIRVPPLPIGVERYSLLGFDAVPISSSELYTALQLGTVDGRTFGTASEIWNQRDVIETYVRTMDGFEHAFWVVNPDWWNGLDEDTRAKISEAVAHGASKSWERGEQADAADLQRIIDAGVNVVELTDEQMASLREKVISAEWAWMEDQVGKELVDAVRAAVGLSN
jgi:TRAP-type C4-dicarboxylate transport system substrate-binding protein